MQCAVLSVAPTGLLKWRNRNQGLAPLANNLHPFGVQTHMHDDEKHRDNDPLEHAVAALRATDVPPGPPPHLAAATIQAAERESRRPPFIRRLLMLAPTTRYRELAAAILLFAFIGWLIIDTTRTKLA